MASINGVEVKNLKTFRGHEGEPLYQGSVYLNGKRLGFWSQDAWCGCDNYDFNIHLLDSVIEKLRNTSLVETEYRDIFNADCLIDKVIRLKNDEKVYKDFCKKGYQCTLLVTDGYHCFYSATSNKEAILDKSFALNYFKKQIDDFSMKCYKNKFLNVVIYNKPSDFIKNF